MTQPKPKYDLDKAMASPVARRAIERLLRHGVALDRDAIELVENLREAARVQSVEEADRAYVDWILAGQPGWKDNAEERYQDACREARAREAAEKEGA